MERKPITRFLKVMSVLLLIQSIGGIVMSLLMIFLAPAASVAGDLTETMDFGFWLNLAVCTACYAADVILAITALRHYRIGVVYKAAGFTMIALAVFGGMGESGAGNYLSVFLSLLAPALFYYAAYKQNRLDQAGE